MQDLPSDSCFYITGISSTCSAWKRCQGPKLRDYAAYQACENSEEVATPDTGVQHRMTSRLSAELMHAYILQVPGRGVRYQG